MEEIHMNKQEVSSDGEIDYHSQACKLAPLTAMTGKGQKFRWTLGPG